MRSVLRWLGKIPKWIYIIVVVLFAAVYYFFFRPSPVPQLQYAPVQRQDISATISVSGVMAGKNTATLHFLQGGKLSFINVKTGDRVTAGETIAGQDAQALNIALQQAENTLRDKQATVDNVLNNIHLFQYGNGGFSNVGTSNETETQRADRATVQVARDNAVDSVKAAQRNFQDLTVSAPFAGLVISTGIFPGQFTGPTDTVAQIADDSEIFFDTDVDESDIGQVNVGDQAVVTFDTYPNRTFPGTVTEILPQTRTTSTQATVVTARVLINPGIPFISGLPGQASITTSVAKNTLTIPIAALRPDNTVVVKTATGLQIVKVTPGIESDTDVQILQGLKEGQQVVVNPPATLPK